MRHHKHSARHGLENLRREKEDRLTGQLSGQVNLIGLQAKVVSDAPPVFRGRTGTIMWIKGKTVGLEFNDGRYDNQLNIHLRGLFIYNKGKPTGTISEGIMVKRGTRL